MGWCSLCYVSLSEGLVEKRNKSDLPRKGEGRNFWGTNNDPNLNLGWAKKCMDPNCTLTCFFAPRIWSNESEKSGQVRWCHSKSYTVVLQRLLVGGSQANQLHPFLHRKSHHHKFSQKVFFPSTVPLKNLILSCVIFFSESFCFTFAICFFSVYGFNALVRMSSMNWRAPAVFLLHVLMWQCLKINGIYISIYLKIHQQPLPPTIKYHSMYSRIFFLASIYPFVKFSMTRCKETQHWFEAFTREKTALSREECWPPKWLWTPPLLLPLVVWWSLSCVWSCWRSLVVY